MLLHSLPYRSESPLIDASRKKRQVSSSLGRSVLGDISNYAEVISDDVKSKKAHLGLSMLDKFKYGIPFHVWDGNRAHAPMLFRPPAFICDPMPPLPAPRLPASPLKPSSTQHSTTDHFFNDDVETILVTEDTDTSSTQRSTTEDHDANGDVETIMMSDNDEDSLNHSTSEDHTDADTMNFFTTDLLHRYKTIDTVVPNVDQHFLTCIKGQVNVAAFKFIQDAVFAYALIIQGIFPIANDFQGKIGHTENLVLRYLKSKYFPVRKVSWNDLCPYSSTTTNTVIDQAKIAKLIAIDDVINDNYSRLDQHIVCVGTVRIPCIYIGGKTCQTSFERACALGIVTDKIALSTNFHVCQCRIKGKTCLVLEDRAHPSAHLMDGSSKSNEEFMETIFILNAMGRSTYEAAELGLDNITPEMFQTCLDDELKELSEELKKQMEGRELMTALLYNDPSGQFPKKHRMLRYMKGHDEEIRKLVLVWKGWGPKVLWSILLHGYIYLNPLEYNEPVRFWREVFSNDDLFARFMSSGVARFLINDSVTEMLVYLRVWFNNDEAFIGALSHGLALSLSDSRKAFDFSQAIDDLLDQVDYDITQFSHQLRTYGTHLYRKVKVVDRNALGTNTKWELKLVELKEWKTDQIVSLTFMVYQHIVNRLVFLLNALRPCVICRHTRRGGTS